MNKITKELLEESSRGSFPLNAVCGPFREGMKSRSIQRIEQKYPIPKNVFKVTIEIEDGYTFSFLASDLCLTPPKYYKTTFKPKQPHAKI